MVNRVCLKLDEVKTYFSQFGPIQEVRIILDKISKTSRGFGFVLFKSQKSQTAAIEYPHQHEINGRQIQVTQTKLREELIKSESQKQSDSNNGSRSIKEKEEKKKDSLYSSILSRTEEIEIFSPSFSNLKSNKTQGQITAKKISYSGIEKIPGREPHAPFKTMSFNSGPDDYHHSNFNFEADMNQALNLWRRRRFGKGGKSAINQDDEDSGALILGLGLADPDEQLEELYESSKNRYSHGVGKSKLNKDEF